MFRTLDELNAGCIVYTPHRGVIAACNNFARIVDRDIPDIIGVDMEALTHPKDWGPNRWMLNQALSSGAPFTLRKRYMLPNGTSRWVENRYIVLQRGRKAPIVSILSRCVSPPAKELELRDDESKNYGLYLEEICWQFAKLAIGAGMIETSELLYAASRAAGEEALSF